MPGDPERRIARLLREDREAVLDRLVEQALAAESEPEEPPRLRTAAQIRPLAATVLDDLVRAFASGGWDEFRDRYAAPAEALVASDAGAGRLHARVRRLTLALLPTLLAAEPPVEPLVAHLVDRLYGLSQALADGYQARLGRQGARLDDLKSTFLRLTTHELRAPLGTIRGYATMIAAGDLGEPAPGIRQGVERITAAADAVLKLAEDLGEVARLDDEEAVLKLRDFPLAELLREAAEAVRMETERRHVEIVRTSEAVSARVDPDRAKVALSNLLSNAVKHSEPGARVELRGAREGSRAVITVRDHGPGITAEDMPLVFDKYFRSASSRRAGVPGTGLGLYIVKRLAELHGGEVSLESPPGGGVLARLVFPAAAA